MALTITDSEITSDITTAHATAVDDYGAWVVTYAEPGWPYYGRLFDRNQAITAMTIAEERTRPEPNRALIESLEGELVQ